MAQWLKVCQAYKLPGFDSPLNSWKFFFFLAFDPSIFSAGPMLNPTRVIDLHKDINCTHDGFKHD